MDKKNWIRQLVQDSYSAIASEFDQTRKKQPWSELELLTREIQPNDSVLDLGCGNGRLLKALVAVNFTYRGIDSNPYLIEQARKVWPDRKFEVGELTAVNIAENSYDAIFLIASFHHLVDGAERRELLKKIFKGLKPGGRLLMTNWNLWQGKYLPYLVKWPQKKVSWNDFFIPWGPSDHRSWRYYHGFTSGELQRLIKQSGLSLDRQKTVNYNFVTLAHK